MYHYTEAVSYIHCFSRVGNRFFSFYQKSAVVCFTHPFCVFLFPSNMLTSYDYEKMYVHQFPAFSYYNLW